MEIMAAVPSVVIGFLILLWLAPLMGKWLVAAFASLLTIPAVFLLFMVLLAGGAKVRLGQARGDMVTSFWCCCR